MRGKVNHVKMLLCVLFLALPARAQYGGGTGEPNDPYLIYTGEQMDSIRAGIDDRTKHFKLMADIDLNGYTGTDFHFVAGISGFDYFSGTFDGNGHSISNFTYTSPYSNNVGLFRSVSGGRIKDLRLIAPNVDAGRGIAVGALVGHFLSGTITNCHVEGGNVSGGTCIGGLVGVNRGTIINSSATCNVSAGGDYVGGLVGQSRSLISICWAAGDVVGRKYVGGLVGAGGTLTTQCYALGNVSGSDCVGGLIGSAVGSISYCYALGSVSGYERVGGLAGYNSRGAWTTNCYSGGNVAGWSCVGGLVGGNAAQSEKSYGTVPPGSVRNCYSVAIVSGHDQVGGLVGCSQNDDVRISFWDMETSGQRGSSGGIGKTTAEMQDPNTFMDAGWDFVGASDGPGDSWAVPNGGGYPILWWQLSPLPALSTFSSGTGKPDDPYLISTADDLNSIGNNPRLMAAHFKLIADIDLAGVDFFIIGGKWNPFRGTFEGGGHTVSNFKYNSEDTNSTGLFGSVADGKISGVGLIDPVVVVAGGHYHGALMGFNEGILTDCYVESVNISGDDYVGGLVGLNGILGTISRCYAMGNVTGKEDVGGLVGGNDGEIIDCYATAEVIGNKRIGGLVGTAKLIPGYVFPYAVIRRCFAVGRVSGNEYVGGLAGRSESKSVIMHSFWDIESTGQSTSAGGQGITTAQMQTADTFLDAGWDFVGETENGTEDIWCIRQEPGYPTFAWMDLGQ